MKAIRLRCEQMENPLGIDVQKPCLSWICQDGIHQTAYEIEAKTGEDVIYNSGKVASDSMNVMLDADLASKRGCLACAPVGRKGCLRRVESGCSF